MLAGFVLLMAACGGDTGAEAGTEAGAEAGAEAEAEAGTEAGATGGPDYCAAAAAEPITIVHLSDIAGESATAISDFVNGSTMAAADINEACGLDFVTIERIPTDFSVAGMEPNLLQAQEMEPTAIIGQGSSSQIALNNIVDEGGIPLIWPVGTGNGLLDGENGSEWAWMARPVNDTQGLVWGTHLGALGAQSVWLECVETQFGISGCDNAEALLAQQGVTIAGRASSAFDASDFTQSIVDLLAAEADAIALVQFPGPQIAFEQQMEDNDALDVTIMGGASTEVIYQALSADQQAATIAIADCNPREDDPAVNRRYAAQFGSDMTGLAATTYDAVFLVVDAVARQGGADPASVKSGLESTAWDGVCQNYSDSGNHALAHRTVVTSFKGGIITTETEYLLDDTGTALAP